MRINDAVFGAALWLLAGLVLWQIGTFPSMPGQSFGPALVPGLLATGFALCGALLMIGGVRHRHGRPWAALGAWRRDGRLLDGAIVLGGLALLILGWSRLGFLIGGSFYSFLLIWRFRGGNPLLALSVAVIACFLIDWGFRRLLLVPLPLGPLKAVVW